MGTKISRQQVSGTLGGFVDMSDGGKGFVTCAHVVGSVEGNFATISLPSLGEMLNHLPNTR